MNRNRASGEIRFRFFLILRLSIKISDDYKLPDFRNPWDKNKLADMGEDDFNGFICVEAAQNSRRIYVGRDETWTANHTITLGDD